MIKRFGVQLILGLLLALFATVPAFAQSTSAALGGQVTTADGTPLSGADVVIVHTPSGTTSRATTKADGRYVSRGLRVGGPYTITVTKDGYQGKAQENVYLNLAETAQISTQLVSSAPELEAIVVVASANDSVFSPENTGVGTSVGGRQMEIMPQSNRSIDDVARLDPRITVLDQASGAISVAGINNRYNDISVDGLSQGDPFGLNANGMPYVGSPVSVDTIEAYDIKVSDFDVASDSVGASVNAVTKSGGNEFHGSAYYVLKDSDWVGSRNGDDYGLFSTDETWGATLGGPILQDRLFFYASYEEQEVADFGGATPADGVSSGRISLDEVNEAIAIADSLGIQNNVYGALDSVLKTKRYLAKLDWNINENHRASLAYQQTEEARPRPYDLRSNSVILTNHWYFTNNETKNTTLQLFSDWTDSFSTELKIANQTFDQINGAFVKNTEVQVDVPGGTIFIGEDDNRHENQINTDRIDATFAGTYFAGDHTIKGGVDYLRHDVFNLYGKTLHGEWRFDSLEDFAAGNYDQYTIRMPAAGFGVEDTAAALVYTQVSPFIQDTWQVNDNLSIQYGVRMNIPKAKSAPEVAPGFQEAFGYTNAYKLGSSNKVILPRASFNYQFDTERYSQLRGGIGAFQSIPPFVWLANPYQNNGVTAVRFRHFDPSTLPFEPDPYNQPLPPGVTLGNLVCGEDGVTCQVDAMHPDFKLPSVWKLSLGYDHELPWWGMIASVEWQSIRARDGMFYQAINLGEAQGQLADGRDYFYCNLGFSGSGSSSNRNCDANPAFSTRSTVMTNTDKGKSNAITFSLSKPMSNGWYGNLSYTYTDADEVASDGSSQAFSSYQFVSRLNPNQEIATTAGRLIRNSIKLSLGWEHAFFGDYKTSITAFYNGRDGLPYTWTFNGDPNGDGIFQDPVYIPLVDDPIVSYGSATPEQIAAFHEFINNNSYLASRRGQVAERNGDHYPWVNQLDLGIQQELPGFMKEHKAVLRVDVYNFLNLLSNDWGLTYGDTFSDNTRQLTRFGGLNADGTYVYNLGSPDNPNAEDLEIYDSDAGYPSRLVSRWSVMATLRYEF
ncbi:MAG: TonB-dependent receptor [Xanthomonadales bacterium]|nr:TonB-dependent receptor [Xanthomonadales bacterium]